MIVAAAAVVGGVLAVVQPSAVADDGPGSLVSSTPLAGGQLPSGAAAGHKIRYTSTGPTGAPNEVTGLVYLPQGPAPEGGWRVLSWAHGTTGVGDDCAPSVLNPNGYLSHWLQAGYAVVATDYAGMGTEDKHAYLAGEAAAHNVIDIVRAGRALDPGLSEHWFVAGQSQGGHAAVHTGRVATTYAPELDFRGTIGHGVPSNLSYFVSLIGPKFPPALASNGTKLFFTYILAGARVAMPDFDLASYLTPLGTEIVDKAEVLCSGALMQIISLTNLADMFTKDLGAEFQQAWGAVFDVPVTGYDRPLMIIQGTNDEVVPTALTQQLVDDLEANNQPLTYKTYPASHTGAPETAIQDALAFADTLFADIEEPEEPLAETVLKIDPETAGWHTTPFSATWSATGATTCDATTYSGPDTTTGRVTGACTDAQGRRTAEKPYTFKYDGTAPDANLTSAGFVRSLTGTTADATSGVASVEVTLTELFGKRVVKQATLTGDTWSLTGVKGIYTATAVAKDNAGNRSPATQPKLVLVY
ncbi:alpha/beta hydrolase family protein [Actinokineospora pegani]|uniref:alpha/beta hydrolase family protein n=1 Tax=Actinokineospora pegani TaxID=2654637 RepID=UPI0012EA6374|nr:lipase family protein [Actinokineospora pegani]